MVDIPNSVAGCRARLRERLGEAAPARIQLLTGPRQVGKTTLLLELAAQQGERAVYAAGDEPGAGLPGFWERSWAEAERRAQGRGGVLLLDEVHHFADWASRLKGSWDRVRRQHIPLHVVATGSSALRVAAGSRESLAGRFERMTLGHWPAAALAQAFGGTGREAAARLVRFGGYPGAVELEGDSARWRAYVRDAILEPAMGRDLLAGGTVRRPGLLRQIFAVAASSPAQIVSLQKVQGQLLDRGALETVAHYLALLQDAYLVAGLEKFSGAAHRRRAAPPKLVVLNNALLSAVHPEGAPEAGREPQRWGAWVENACLAFGVNQGQRVAYWREEPLEVDGIFEGSWGKWAIEVKTGRYHRESLRGLLEFCRRWPAWKPLVVCSRGEEETARRHGVASVSWEDFLVTGPPGRIED